MAGIGNGGGNGNGNGDGNGRDGKDSRYHHEQPPQRFREYDEDTQKWLYRMNSAERVNLIWWGRKSDEYKKRLDALIGLPEDRWKAIFQVNLIWANLSWTLMSGAKIVLAVAGMLVAYNNIWPYIQGLLGG